MSFCNKCGFRTRDADRFCQNCGHEISTPVPQTHNRFSDEKKQALSKLNNILFLIFIIVDEFFLLRFSMGIFWKIGYLWIYLFCNKN
jgi:uncharacterized membrane protein YvbJ